MWAYLPVFPEDLCCLVLLASFKFFYNEQLADNSGQLHIMFQIIQVGKDL